VLFDLVIATTNPYRGFGLGNKQNGTEKQRTVRYRNCYSLTLLLKVINGKSIWEEDTT